MNKYFVLWLFVFAQTALAADSYDPATKVITIPSIMVGDSTYSNVSLQLNDFTVLDFNQNPTAGMSLKSPPLPSGTASGIDLTVGNFSRGATSLGDGRVSFSIKVTNTTTTNKYIAGVVGTPNLSTLSDEKGNVCDSHLTSLTATELDPGNFFYTYETDLHISGIGILISGLDENAGINSYTVIEPGRTKIIGISSFNPSAVDSSQCYFTGDYFTFQFYLKIFNTTTQTGELVYFDDFKDIPIPANDVPTTTVVPTTGGTSTSCTDTSSSPTDFWGIKE